MIQVFKKENKLQKFKCSCGNEDPKKFGKYYHYEIEEIGWRKIRVPRVGLACFECDQVITQTEIEKELDN